MARADDLGGLRFGRLTARTRTRLRGRVAWECDCRCGGVVTVQADSLARGLTRSCGCLHRHRDAARLRTKLVTAPVTEAEHAAIVAHCESRGISMSALMRGFLVAAGLAGEGEPDTVARRLTAAD